MSVSKSYSGNCLCGAVEYEATISKPHIDACHCGMCRRQTGGPVMAVIADSLEVKDEADLGVYSSSDWAERCFCRKCGSNLFYRLKNGVIISVHAGSMNGIEDFTFKTEIFIEDKPNFYAFSGDRRRMTGAEVIAEVMGKTEGSDNG